MKNKFLNANKGLKTKFDASKVKFKSTFNRAKKLGVDLNNTTEWIKKDNTIYKISFISYKSKVTGRYTEVLDLLPMIILKK